MSFRSRLAKFEHQLNQFLGSALPYGDQDYDPEYDPAQPEFWQRAEVRRTIVAAQIELFVILGPDAYRRNLESCARLRGVQVPQEELDSFCQAIRDLAAAQPKQRVLEPTTSTPALPAPEPWDRPGESLVLSQHDVPEVHRGNGATNHGRD